MNSKLIAKLFDEKIFEQYLKDNETSKYMEGEIGFEELLTRYDDINSGRMQLQSDNRKSEDLRDKQ